VVSFEKLK